MWIDILDKLQGQYVYFKTYYSVTFEQSYVLLSTLQIKHFWIVQILLTQESRGTFFPPPSIKKNKSNIFFKNKFTLQGNNIS